MPQRRNELADKAVLVFATAWVVFGGIATSVFLIFTNSTNPSTTLLYLAGGGLAVALVLWILREPDPLSPRGSIFAWFRRPKSITYHYKLKVRKPGQVARTAPQQPPTAERIREIAQDNMATWVLTRVNPRHRDRPKDQ